MSAPAERHACPGAPDRRAFLQRATLSAAGVLLGLGAAPHFLRAAGVREVAADAPLPETSVRTYPMPAADGAAVDPAHEVLIVRWAGRVHAFSLACPHRGTRLKWQGIAGGVYCPKHKARFRADGAHVGGRRTRDLDRYAVRRDGDRLSVDLGARLRADVDAAAWAAASVTVEGG